MTEDMTHTSTIARFSEVETKYRVDPSALVGFKKLVEVLPEHTFLYVQGDDEYYVAADRPFLRLRIAQYFDDSRTRFIQLTSKIKPEGAKNNIFRQEVNLSLMGNNLDEIRTFISMAGYTPDFVIWKTCHIYFFPDANLVFYAVREAGGDEHQYFVEIEVKEEIVHELTEDQAWGIIEKYESVLAPIGISPQKRMKKSLFDLFHKV